MLFVVFGLIVAGLVLCGYCIYSNTPAQKQKQYLAEFERRRMERWPLLYTGWFYYNNRIIFYGDYAAFIDDSDEYDQSVVKLKSGIRNLATFEFNTPSETLQCVICSYRKTTDGDGISVKIVFIPVESLYPDVELTYDGELKIAVKPGYKQLMVAADKERFL